MLNTSQNQINTIATGEGTYILSVIDSINGCVDSSQVTLIELENDISGINLTAINPLCFNENSGMITISEIFGGTGPYEYSLDGVIYTSGAAFNNLGSGEYTFFAKDSFGCVISDTIVLLDPIQIELELGENIDVFLGDEVTISANTNLTQDQIQEIIWQISNQIGCSDCLSFTLSPNQDLFIQLEIMDNNGCKVSDEINVRVDQEPVLYRPNIFSPNNDGINDIFYLSANQGIEQISAIYIFDRWGNKVFQNNNFLPGDIDAGWNGTLGGNVLLPGVYVYTAEVKMISGITRIIRGNVTLIR
jgi:gliding motility-associated-like protein